MIHDDHDIYDEAYIRRRRAEMIPDGGSVRVPVLLMDGAQRENAGRYSLADARLADAVKLRDEAYADYLDRLRNPKNYDHNGRRLNDGSSRSAPRPTDANERLADALELRDEAHALMVDRMRNPKSYDHSGRRI